MNGLPWHPALVHLPLGVALIIPAVMAMVLWARRGGKTGRGAWWIVTVLQAAVFVGALAASSTGEDIEEQAEARVGEAAVELHEERAEVFTWLAGVTLAVVAAGAMATSTPAAPALGGLALLLSIIGLAQGLRTGHAGGALVYGAGAQGVAARSGATQRGEDDRSDEEGRRPRAPAGTTPAARRHRAHAEDAEHQRRRVQMAGGEERAPQDHASDDHRPRVAARSGATRRRGDDDGSGDDDSDEERRQAHR